MRSAQNLPLFICDLGDLTVQIILDAWWASMNVCSKKPIGWNISRHAPLWQFYLYCGIKNTGSPGIIIIVCHQAPHHSSEHRNCSMGKHLLGKVQISRLNDITVSEGTELTSSTVDEMALAIIKKQASRGIPIVSSLRKFVYNI
jgi:hypothetical protein